MFFHAMCGIPYLLLCEVLILYFFCLCPTRMLLSIVSHSNRISSFSSSETLTFICTRYCLMWYPSSGILQSVNFVFLMFVPYPCASFCFQNVSHSNSGKCPVAYFIIKQCADWGPLVDVVGYCFLNLGSKYQPQEEFVQWIQKGSQPIYIGFGSMVW